MRGRGQEEKERGQNSNLQCIDGDFWAVAAFPAVSQGDVCPRSPEQHRLRSLEGVLRGPPLSGLQK